MNEYNLSDAVTETGAV